MFNVNIRDLETRLRIEKQVQRGKRPTSPNPFPC
jgi:hypothetical protein